MPKTADWITMRSAASTSWYRHITLVLLALGFLTGMCATERFSTSAPAPSELPLTVPEVRHLLARLIWPSSSSVYRVLAWSWWRRCHQSRASYYHTKRRRDRLADPDFFAIFRRRLLPIVFPPTLPGNFLEVSELREISRNWGFSCLPFCLFSKGNSIMTPLSVTDGARLLGIHPKTLCHWLTQANIPLAAHPADARITCVTQEDLHQLASLHDRQLMQPLLLLSPLKCKLSLGLNMKENQLPQLVRSPSPTGMKQTRSKDWLP